MGFNYNRVLLSGNLTRDPEVKTTQSGAKFCDFTLAINRKFGERQEICYVPVTVWNKQAESCAKFLAKGSCVFIEGRLVYETWEGKNGENHNKLKVVADTVQFITGKNNVQREEGESEPERAPAPAPSRNVRPRQVSQEYAPEVPEGGELPPF